MQNVDKDDRIIYEKYIELDKSLQKLVSDGIKKALPFVMEASEHLNLTSSCLRNLFTLVSEIRKLKLSAVKFIDAAGKPPTGFLTGTINMIGDYDECLSTEVLRPDGNIAFKGQYCMLNIKPILPKRKGKITLRTGLEELREYTKNTSEVMQFLMSKVQFGYKNSMKYGLCVPSGCSTDDVTSILNYLGERTFMRASVAHCDQQQQFQMHTGMIVAIILFSIAGLFAIIGSSVDYYARKKGISFQKNIGKFLICFSVLTNFPKVINTKTQSTELASLFGIRTLSLFFIILLHQYFMWTGFQMNGHGYVFEDQIPRFFAQVIFNGFLTTEVFFFLGGLLNTYSRINIQESGKRQINAAQLIIHRLWRIYPTYIFSLLTLFLLVSVHGPMGTYMRREFIKPCEEIWWQNLLFINNFFSQDKTCMVHSWYIAADMQLFLLSLITVPVLLKNSRAGIILHTTILIAGLAATVLWAWHKELIPSIIVYRLDKNDALRVRNVYVTALPHIAPYYTGLIAGYILSKWNKFKIPKIYQYFGWPIASACFISMLFITQKWNSGVEFTLIESTLYFAFGRILYVLGVAWLVICCAKGYGGILNYILSLKIWIPLSRISYMVYMVSPILQIHYYGTLKMRMDIDMMTMIWRHIGDLGISCLLGLAMTVIIESPFISMEKLILHMPSTKQEKSGNNANTQEKNISNNEIKFEKNNKVVNTYI